MVVFAGLEFKRVSADYVFREETIIVLKDVLSGAMFVRTSPKQMSYCSVKRYHSEPTKLLNVPRDYVIFENYVHHRFSNDTPSLLKIAHSVRAYLNKQNKLWTQGDETVTDSCSLDFYTYAMINEDSGAVYFDFEEKKKIFINPMNKKAVIYNGSVLARQVHINRTMYYYAEDNFPIKPEAWFSVKLGGVITGRENASSVVSKMSVDFIRNNFLVLNRVYGSDAHYYRNNHSGLIPTAMIDYINIKREDTYDALEAQMVGKSI